MKLYIYDHCPYCVRARMIFGLRGLAVEETVLLNDDEATPIRLIGSKQVPILEKPDGSHMGESLDIVRYIDQYAQAERLDDTSRPAVQNWFDRVGSYYNQLIMPRDIRLQLPEFATQSAIDYFVRKKEAQIGPFAEHLAQTEAYLARIHADLAELDTLLPAAAPYFNGSRAGMEDIILFPVLRNLSMVSGLNYPPRLAAYLHHMAERSKVPLYSDRAL